MILVQVKLNCIISLNRKIPIAPKCEIILEEKILYF